MAHDTASSAPTDVAPSIFADSVITDSVIADSVITDSVLEQLDGPHDKKERIKWLLRKLNPVSPRARTDIRIIRNYFRADKHAKEEVKDTHKHPEILQVAHVRTGVGLCPEEIAFAAERKEHVRRHFARYLDLDPETVNPDDIPTVALGGSGGGFRSMIGFLAYSAEMKKMGLWELLTYVAGVSGSCWSIAAYFTFGDLSMEKVLEHCKRRFHPHHPLSDDAIRAVLSTPGAVDLLIGPLDIKDNTGLNVVPMDYYAVLVNGHIFLHDEEEMPDDVAPSETSAGFREEWFKWTNAQQHLKNGAEPLPILTAIRHDRPWKYWVDKEDPFQPDERYFKTKDPSSYAWWQWYEMTPFEIGCDELEAWVPTWAFGRPFDSGTSTLGLPEHSLALLLGLCTSAPAGSMSSYIAVIKRNLPGNFFGRQIHDLALLISRLWGKHSTAVFEGHHPLHACNEHNFCYHLTKERPPGIQNSPRIHLIDSGIDNNCPTYVMLHPEREVDVILNMDASSDVEKDQQERIDQIGGRRGIKFTRRWPDDTPYAQIFDGVLSGKPETVVDSYGKTVPTPPGPICRHECSMVYMPLLPNEKAVPGFNPCKEKFSSSYNLVWTPEQIETLVKVSVANAKAAEPVVKKVLREAYEKKKALREASSASSTQDAHSPGSSTPG
ncbi:putative cytosolic phospholipase A2 [Thozetella sp. PMI_491]|nr:putative cytosolic phospholipase A2 [Thozetella sp. PMI_491]